MQKDPEPAALSEGERRILETIEAEFDAGDPEAPRAELAARRTTGSLRRWLDRDDGTRGPVREDRR